MLADYTVVNMVEGVTLFQHMVGWIMFIPSKREAALVAMGHVSCIYRAMKEDSTPTHLMVVNQPQCGDRVIASQQRLGYWEKAYP